jgi:multiple sugar transport system ATP-binding protein
LAEVRFQQVSKTYPPRRGSADGAPVPVLRALDLTIADGEFLVLVGPSGCGKSTLLRLLAGLDTPTSGSIHVGGRDVTGLRPSRRDVAMVFQSYALYPHLTVADNLSFGLRRSRPRSAPHQLQDALHRLGRRWPAPLRLPSPREAAIERRVKEVARMLELEPLLARLPKELSGGQKQRVALGRAIARQPAVFLMDEPLSNLDAKLRTGTRAQITALQRQLGTTTLYVTHDQVEAMTMGHRIAVLNGGRLQQLGTPMELYRWPSNLFVAQFIGSPPMNLLAAEVAGSGQVLVAGRRFPVEGPLEPLLGPLTGQSLTAGLRPEHLRLAPATNRNLAAEVCHVEALGNEQLVTCRLREGSQLVLVRADPEVAVAAGEAVHVEVDPSGWRLFDGEGEALLPPNTAALYGASNADRGGPTVPPRGPQLPRIG